MSRHAAKTTYPECDCGGCTNQNHPIAYVPRHSSDLPPVGMVGGSDEPPNAAPTTTGLPVVGVLAVDATGGGAASSVLGRLAAANTNPGAQQ